MSPYKITPWSEDDEFKSHQSDCPLQKKFVSTRKELLFAYGLALLLLGILIFRAETCNAAMLATMSSVSTTTVGQVFTVDVYAVPQGKGDTGYLVQSVLYHPNANLISWESNSEFKEVKLKKYWKQNTMYTMRTLGFPNGFTKTKKVGTATFESTKEGKVEAGLVGGFVLDAKGENTFNF